VRDWKLVLPPGTLLCSRNNENLIGLVIHVDVIVKPKRSFFTALADMLFDVGALYDPDEDDVITVHFIVSDALKMVTVPDIWDDWYILSGDLRG